MINKTSLIKYDLREAKNNVNLSQNHKTKLQKNMEITKFDKLAILATKMRILNQILIDIQENGILAPSLERELADNDLIDIIETINSTPKRETINIIMKKIDNIKQQIKKIVK